MHSRRRCRRWLSFSYRPHRQGPPPAAPHYAANDNTTLDEASLFLAGGDGNHFGGFAQVTYDGVDRGFSWDNLDLRAIDHYALWGSDVLFRPALNNNPTIQDAWATLPGWGFPFTDSALAPGPCGGVGRCPIPLPRMYWA